MPDKEPVVLWRYWLCDEDREPIEPMTCFDSAIQKALNRFKQGRTNPMFVVDHMSGVSGGKWTRVYGTTITEVD